MNDIIDAFADAATSAENTVDTEGCKAEATITQAQSRAKTLDSATDSLNASLKSIQEKTPKPRCRSEGRFGWRAAAGQSSNNPSGRDRTEPLRTALLRTVPPTRNRWMNPKRNCNSRIDEADKLVDKLSKDDSPDPDRAQTAVRAVQGRGLRTEARRKQQHQGFQVLQGGQGHADEAIDMADNWVNSQAAKAQ